MRKFISLTFLRVVFLYKSLFLWPIQQWVEMTQTSSVMKQSSETLVSKVPGPFPRERSILINILRKYESDPWLEVTTVDLKTAVNVGDNTMSTIQRAHVEGFYSNGTYFHKNFILKRQMEDAQKRALFMAEQVWANEEHMYFTVLPRLRRHTNTDLPLPRLYHSDAEIMVMEDLKDAGYFMANRMTGMDLEHSLLVMKNIALFHASSLAMQRLDPEIFNIMKTNLKHPYTGPDGIKMGAFFIRHGIQDATALIKSENSNEKYTKVLNCLDHIEKKKEHYIAMLQTPSNSDLTVVIHGDLWVNNILFSRDRNTNKPNLVKFVDFQCTRIGSIATDLLHFIYTSIEPNTRKKSLDVLLKFYYDNLIGYLESFLGSQDKDYVQAITFSRITEEITKYRMYGLINAILILPVVLCDPKAMSTPNADLRNGNAKSLIFRERLLDVAEEYISKGWMGEA